MTCLLPKGSKKDCQAHGPELNGSGPCAFWPSCRQLTNYKNRVCVYFSLLFGRLLKNASPWTAATWCSSKRLIIQHEERRFAPDVRTAFFWCSVFSTLYVFALSDAVEKVRAAVEKRMVCSVEKVPKGRQIIAGGETPGSWELSASPEGTTEYSQERNPCFLHAGVAFAGVSLRFTPACIPSPRRGFDAPLSVQGFRFAPPLPVFCRPFGTWLRTLYTGGEIGA